jgi:septum formation inhibitor-activating ATPase MinD
VPLDAAVAASGDAGTPFVGDEASAAAVAFAEIVERIEQAMGD